MACSMLGRNLDSFDVAAYIAVGSMDFPGNVETFDASCGATCAWECFLLEWFDTRDCLANLEASRFTLVHGLLSLLSRN